MSYQSDRQWSDEYVWALRQVVGPRLLDEAPLEQDNQQATDLILFRARDLDVGCRVRRPGYADRYPWQFTIRSLRDTGARTELSKIIDGWCDWYVYAHAKNDTLPLLERWFLLDLKVFRSTLIRHPRLLDQKRQVPNGDGTHFMPYDVREFPDELVIAASHIVPRQAAA